MSNVEPRWRSEEIPEYATIADVEWEDESYQFDMTRVYQHKTTGELFYAEDSGCSCPCPFEDTQVKDLKPITRMQDWYDHVTARTVNPDPGQEYQYPRPTPTSAFDEAETARRAIQTILTERKK